MTKALRTTAAILAVTTVLPACSSMSNTQKGAVIGAAVGGAVGAIIGKKVGSAANDAIYAAAVGGTAGAVMGAAWTSRQKSWRWRFPARASSVLVRVS